MKTFKFIVRSIGERTESVCVHLLKLQMLDCDTISVIREPSHAKAIEKTYTLGIESMADWVIAVDADVLFLPDAVSQIRKELDSCADDVFVINSAVFDKIYSMKRWAGVHVYRRMMLEDLYSTFKTFVNLPNLKIEAAAIKEFQKNNKQSYFSKNIVGTHDFHQNYKDLYRKAYLNTVRNPGNIDRARCNWKKKSLEDSDYLVMLKAMQDALAENKQLANSLEDFSTEELVEKIEELGLTEKPRLIWDEYINNCLKQSLCAEIRSNEIYSEFNDFYETNEPVNIIKSLIIKWSPGTLHSGYQRIKKYYKS